MLHIGVGRFWILGGGGGGGGEGSEYWGMAGGGGQKGPKFSLAGNWSELPLPISAK